MFDEVSKTNTPSGLWQRIEAALLDDIDRRAFPIGAKLPSEGELAVRFGVNRHTVRRAIASLAQRGLVRSEQGRGVFLIGSAIDYQLGPRTRFSENLRRAGRIPGHDFLSVDAAAADAATAAALDIRCGAPVVRLRAVGRADGVPISYSEHIFPTKRLPGIAAALAAARSITAALRQVGVVDYRRRSTRIVARLPTAAEIDHLDLTAARPVLVTESLNEAGCGPVDTGFTAFAADRVQLVVE